MVNEPIDRREGHRSIDENVAPLRERRIRRNGDTFALIAFGDQSAPRFRLHRADVAQIVEDDQIEAIELGELLRQPQIPPGSVKSLHQVAAPRKEHAFAGVDQCMT